MPSIKASLLFALSLGLIPQLAEANRRQAEPCESALEKEATRLVFDLRLAMNETNALDADEFARIHAALHALEANAESPAARACFVAYPDQKRRYQVWVEVRLRSVMGQARERLSATCRRRTESFVGGKQLAIDRAIRQRRLATAKSLAQQLRQGISDRAIIRDCAATKDLVNELTTSYLPTIDQAVDLARVIARAKEHYDAARIAFETAQEGLSQADYRSEVMPALEHAEQAVQLANHASECHALARAAVKLGASAETPVTDSASLDAARSSCEEWQGQVDRLVAKIGAYNKRVRALALTRWKRTALRGYDMEQLFAERGRPIHERSYPRGPSFWLYYTNPGIGVDGGCVQFRFSPKGKQMAKNSASCPSGQQ